MLHVQPQPLRRLTAVPGRQRTAIEFAGYVFDDRLHALDFDVLEHLLGKAEFLGKAVHDFVVRFGLEDRLYDLLAPLNRPVRCGS